MKNVQTAARGVYDMIVSEIAHKYPEGHKWTKLINSDAFRALDNELRPVDNPKKKERARLISRLAGEQWGAYTNSELLSACKAIDEIGKE